MHWKKELKREREPGEWCCSGSFPKKLFDGEVDENSTVECPCCGKEVKVICETEV